MNLNLKCFAQYLLDQTYNGILIDENEKSPQRLTRLWNQNIENCFQDTQYSMKK